MGVICWAMSCRELKLRIGTQVLLTTNLDVGAKLANGSRGIVTDFVSARDHIPQMDRQNVSAFARSQEMARPDLLRFVGPQHAACPALSPHLLFWRGLETHLAGHQHRRLGLLQC